MDSFQVGDAIDQVKGLNRLYILVVSRESYNLLICAIILGCPTFHCLTYDVHVDKSSLTLLFSQQASVFYRVSPKHKVAIVKVRFTITLLLLCSHLLCFSLDDVHSMNNSANWSANELLLFCYMDKRVWQSWIF